MENQLEIDVYFTLLGQYGPADAVPRVPNAYGPDSACTRHYDRMHEYRERIWQRLGSPEDEDLENLIGCLEDIQRELCILMFRQGQGFPSVGAGIPDGPLR